MRADYNLDQLSTPAQVVARALQQYGMILADGGNLTFVALNDRFTTNKWADVGFGPNDLKDQLEWSDFEVVELGTRYSWDAQCDCQRTQVVGGEDCHEGDYVVKDQSFSGSRYIEASGQLSTGGTVTITDCGNVTLRSAIGVNLNELFQAKPGSQLSMEIGPVQCP